MKTVLILCGGQSAEHAISVASAKTIVKALDPALYNIHVVGISLKGVWIYLDLDHLLSLTTIDVPPHHSPCGLYQEESGVQLCVKHKKILLDVIFPVLHGPNGEDGTLQGLCDSMNIPCVGSGVLASATCMDKDIFKAYMMHVGIPVVPYIRVDACDPLISYEEASRILQSSTLFIKPSFMGSSVGIGKVTEEQAFHKALLEAFQYGHKVIIEKAIVGREIECALLGNGPYEASTLCEIIPTHDFYSYEAKYLDPEGAVFKMNPVLEAGMLEKIQDISKKVAKAMACKGMVRVDFFVADQIYVNEVNTIPGFTAISMYPQLWQHQGLSLKDLCHKLIDLALDDFNRKQSYCLMPSPVS